MVKSFIDLVFILSSGLDCVKWSELHRVRVITNDVQCLRQFLKHIPSVNVQLCVYALSHTPLICVVYNIFVPVS